MFVEQPLDSPGSAKYLIINIVLLFFFMHMFNGFLRILDASNAMIRTAVNGKFMMGIIQTGVKLIFLVSLQCAWAVGKANVM